MSMEQNPFAELTSLFKDKTQFSNDYKSAFIVKFLIENNIVNNNEIYVEFHDLVDWNDETYYQIMIYDKNTDKLLGSLFVFNDKGFLKKQFKPAIQILI